MKMDDNIGVPQQIIHLRMGFPYKPSSYWGTPMTNWKPHMMTEMMTVDSNWISTRIRDLGYE